MADGQVVFSTTLDNKQLEKDLASITKKIEKTDESIRRMKEKRSKDEELSLFKSGELDTEKAKLKEIKDRLQELRALSKDKSLPITAREDYSAQVSSARQELSDQQTLVRGLQSEYNVINGRLERCEQKIAESTADLDAMKDKAGELVAKIEEASAGNNRMGEAIEKAGSHMDNFLNRVKSLAARVFVFSLITRVFNAILSWMSKMVQKNDEAAQATARLKGALLTMAQPILNVVIPAFVFLVNLLTRIITVVSKLFAALFGYSYDDTKKQAAALNKEADAIGGVGKAAKEASKYLARFDELNTMPEENGSMGGGGIGGGSASPDFNFDTGFITDKLDVIAVYVAGALLAIGAILAFSGINIPLGITLMALGAVVLAAEVKENWNEMDGAVGRAVTAVLGILGGAALVIGAILTFSGAAVPLGIGLMIAGAVTLAGTVALNWETVSGFVGKCIDDIKIILGSALLSIGAVLALSGAHLALGLALIAVGAAVLVNAIEPDWNCVTEAMQGTIGAMTAALSGAFLALGALLTFTGANLPLGIGLMAVGAAGLVAVAAINWNSIVEAMQGPVGAVTAIVSVALLALGVILAFSGVGLPLGISLIAAGAAGLVTVTAMNWNTILEKLQGVWSSITQWFNTNVAPKLTASYWQEKFFAIGEGMKNGLKWAANGVIGIVNNLIAFVVNGINSLFQLLSFDIPLPGGGSIGLQLPQFTPPQIPMLAKGAVIPPNREFMAVLGDQKHGNNIEAPEDLIRKIVREETVGRDDGELAALLEELIDAVLNIRVGDDVIGRAAQRYSRQRSRATGG